MRQALAKKLADDNKDAKAQVAALEKEKDYLTEEAARMKALVQKLSKDVERERQAAAAAAAAADRSKETATELQRQLALCTAQVSGLRVSACLSKHVCMCVAPCAHERSTSARGWERGIWALTLCLCVCVRARVFCVGGDGLRVVKRGFCR